MLSRVAENIYWMARSLERAEDTARLVNVTTHLALDLPKQVSFDWELLLHITGYSEIFRNHYGVADDRNLVRFLVGDALNPGSVISSLGNARENARTIRDSIPREAWEQINNLYLKCKGNLQFGLSRRGRYDYLHWTILGAQTITGMLAGTMTHDVGYDFLRMGRNLERADMTTRIIDVRTASLLPEVLKHLPQTVMRAEVRQPSLEDAFLRLTGTTLEGRASGGAGPAGGGPAGGRAHRGGRR